MAIEGCAQRQIITTWRRSLLRLHISSIFRGCLNKPCHSSNDLRAKRDAERQARLHLPRK